MTLIKVNKPVGHVVSRNRLFPSVFDEFFNDLLNVERAGFVPAVNVSETETGFLIDFQAPGFGKEDFKVEVDNGVITVSGEHKTESTEEEKNYTRKEFTYGSFKRSFTLPESVNEDEINATYENGILKLNLSKRKEEIKRGVKEIRVS